MMGKIRIQILTAIVLLGAISGYAIFADMVEVATSTIAGMTAVAPGWGYRRLKSCWDIVPAVFSV